MVIPGRRLCGAAVMGVAVLGTGRWRVLRVDAVSVACGDVLPGCEADVEITYPGSTPPGDAPYSGRYDLYVIPYDPAGACLAFNGMRAVHGSLLDAGVGQFTVTYAPADWAA